jgi:hypothetical protein
MIYFTYLVCLTLVANASSPSNMEIREDKKYTRLSRVSHLAAPNKIQEWYLGTAVVFRSKLKERRKGEVEGGGREIVRENERQQNPFVMSGKPPISICAAHSEWWPCSAESPAILLIQQQQQPKKICTLHFVRRSNSTIHTDYYWLLIWKKMWWNGVVCTTSFLPSFLPSTRIAMTILHCSPTSMYVCMYLVFWLIAWNSSHCQSSGKHPTHPPTHHP